MHVNIEYKYRVHNQMTGKMMSEMFSDKGKFAQMEYNSPLDFLYHTITPFYW